MLIYLFNIFHGWFIKYVDEQQAEHKTFGAEGEYKTVGSKIVVDLYC